jgi:hypothetical protein
MKQFLFRYPAVILFLLLVAITRPYYYADSAEYARTILDQEAGKPAPLFLHSSHALWRPIGEIVHRGLQPLMDHWGLAPFAQVSASLILVVFLLTFAGVIYLYKLLRLLPLSEASVQSVMFLYVISQCMLNYSQTATSYQAGLSLLIVGLFYTLRTKERLTAKDAMLSGFFLAAAPLLWQPYILALPGALLARPMLYIGGRHRILESIKIAVLCLVAAGIALVPIAIYLQLFSIHAIVGWAVQPGQYHVNAGVQRMIFGLPKMLLYLGRDAIYIKRFMFHDPYNQESALKLLVQLWKVVLFYGFACIAIVTLVRHCSFWKYLPWLTLGILPTVILSIYWDGAALERDMPLIPFLFIAIALWSEASSKQGRILLLTLIIVAAAVNVSALWYGSNDNKEKSISHDIGEIWPRLNSHSIVAVLSSHDDLSEFQWNHPFNEFNQSQRLQLYPVVSIGYDTSRFWKQQFQTAAAVCWQNGGDIWVSRTLLDPRPKKSLYWIENADPGVAWKGITDYFHQLSYSDSTQHFFLLKQTGDNEFH